jgi:hypothetical protein
MAMIESGASAPVGTGLPAERTALGWHRTGLALLVNAAFLIRSAGLNRDYWIVVPAAAIALTGLVAWWPTSPGRERRATCVAYAAASAVTAVVSMGVVTR